MPIDLIEHNPLLKRPLLEVLALTEQMPTAIRAEIEDAAHAIDADSFTRQTPATIVDILIRNAALEERVFVNDAPYEGSLQDVQTDAAVADDAHVDQFLAITETGRELLDEYGGDKKLRELLAAKPHHAEVYQTMLNACATGNGCTRAELERAIEAMPHLAPNPATGIQSIYPQYFIDSLETAGGIAWQGSWHTTDTGRVVMI